MIYKITAVSTCKSCHGEGTVYEYHPYGNTVAAEALTCDCVTEQLPEEFDDMVDEIEVIETRWQGGDGLEPKFDYSDYEDLYND